MNPLREKAIGINEEAFQVDLETGEKKSLGIMASYLHKDVKEAVLEFERYLILKGSLNSRTKRFLEPQETYNKFKQIMGNFEDEKENN